MGLHRLSRDEHDWVSSDLLLQTSEALATLDGTMLIFETSRRNGVSKGQWTGMGRYAQQ